MVKSAELFRDQLSSLLENYTQSSEQAGVPLLVIPILEHYEQFANSFVALMRNKVDVSMMWGLLFLVIKVLPPEHLHVQTLPLGCAAPWTALTAW